MGLEGSAGLESEREDEGVEREREREGGVHVVEEREDMLVPALVDVSGQQPSARKHTQVV